MAGRGPLPSEHSHRAPRRASATTTVRPDDVLRGPELIGDFSAETLAWYADWRRSPQAQLFESTDWLTLRLLAPLVEAHFRRPTAASSAEIRLTQSLLGGTHADRLRLKIRVERDAPVAAVSPIRPERDRIRRRLEASALLAGPQLPDDELEVPAPF